MFPALVKYDDDPPIVVPRSKSEANVQFIFFPISTVGYNNALLLREMIRHEFLNVVHIIRRFFVTVAAMYCSPPPPHFTHVPRSGGWWQMAAMIPAPSAFVLFGRGMKAGEE